MGFLDLFVGSIEEDREIEDDLHSYAPEDREEILLSRYGRCKEEFPWIDFDDDKAERESREYDDDIDDDYDEDDDDDLDDDDYDSDSDFDSDSDSDFDELW